MRNRNTRHRPTNSLAVNGKEILKLPLSLSVDFRWLTLLATENDFPNINYNIIKITILRYNQIYDYNSCSVR